ncbi:macoilin-like [Halichondria panicea]|uniref:macoilin-like n=1 Tax=Halichondria panicea TaxID=6063 RepID=UPI00312B8AC0
MRRRLLDCNRLKRLPMKRTRVPEPGPTNSYIHWKLLVGWLVIILLDTMADFRLELIYPAFMFARSVYDSYKYQGLVFSLLFMYLVVYCDLLWLSLLSGPMLFVAASSCVWFEIVRSFDHVYNWSFLTLWLLFVYVEVSYRFFTPPQHFFNVSRPFAAHCIGYPVVTMSFLIKHQITHIIRQRQRKKVVEENSVYYGIIQKALPQEDIPDDQSSVSEDTPPSLTNGIHSNGHLNKPSPKAATSTPPKQSVRSQNSNTGKHRNSNNVKTSHETKPLSNHKSPPENSNSPSGQVVANGDVGRPMSAGKVHLPSGKKQATVKAVPREEQPLTSPVQDKTTCKNTVEILQTELKHERQARAEAEVTISRLELDIKKLRADLHASCLQEEETTSRVDQLLSSEKHHKQELQRFRAESDTLHNKLSKLSSNKHHDQSSIADLEKKLRAESGERVRVETELRDHKHATQNSWSDEEVQELKCKLSSKDKDIDFLKKDLRKHEKMLEGARKDLNLKENALRSFNEERKQLKASLADETRVKIELFTALSEARRKYQGLMDECQRRDIEINRLRQNLAEVIAIIPVSSVAAGYHPSSPSVGSPQH